jgi:hypothetical protein
MTEKGKGESTVSEAAISSALLIMYRIPLSTVIDCVVCTQLLAQIAALS